MTTSYTRQNRLTVLSLFALLSCGVVQAQTAFTSPVITTQTGTATSYTATSSPPAVIPPGSSVGQTETYNYGTQNKLVTGFTIGGVSYNRSTSIVPSQVFFRKNNASGVNSYPGLTPASGQQTPPWGDRQNFYVEGTYSGGTYNLVGSYPGTVGNATNLEATQAFVQGYANVGTDNTFNNLEQVPGGSSMTLQLIMWSELI